MELNKIIKEIGRGKNHARDIDFDTAVALYGAMLAGEVPELELGAVLIALRIKGEAEEEMLGFYQAMDERVMRLDAPAGKPLPVVIPSYNGARKQANLTPLLALLLVKLGFPVVVHVRLLLVLLQVVQALPLFQHKDGIRHRFTPRYLPVEIDHRHITAATLLCAHHRQ